jgi:hypothetical protein
MKDAHVHVHFSFQLGGWVTVSEKGEEREGRKRPGRVGCDTLIFNDEDHEVPVATVAIDPLQTHDTIAVCTIVK